jgi:hypothetical protein
VEIEVIFDLKFGTLQYILGKFSLFSTSIAYKMGTIYEYGIYNGLEIPRLPDINKDSYRL